MSDSRLYSLVEDRLARDAQSTAFIINDRIVTVAEFDVLCRRLEQWLMQQGIGPGDVVAVWLVNRLEWLGLLFALARRGATLAAINTRYRREEVADLLQRSGARLLVMQQQFRAIAFAEVLSAIDGDRLPALEKIILADSGTLPATLIGKPVESLAPALTTMLVNDAPDRSAPQDCLILFTTSGTTRKPKLVRQPQRSHASHARDAARAYGFDQDNAVSLATLPLCGTFGLNSVLPAFAGGAPVILQETFEVDPALSALERYHVTHMFGSDEMFRRLLENADSPRPFAHARRFGFGAFTSSFDDEARAAWQRGLPLYGLYGSSEVLALFSGQPHYPEVDRRIEGGGRPAAGDRVRIRIRDQESGRLQPDGESGEIEIQAPSQFLGYLNDDEATAEAITPDGYFRTGDLGYLRGDGSFVFQARLGDAIRLSGFLVNPAEIEAVLKNQPGVADAQIVAVDIDGRPRPVAFVIAGNSPAPDADTLIRACKTEMAAFKAPARLWLIDEFPVTPSANGVKVQRNKLRDRALALLASEAGS